MLLKMKTMIVCLFIFLYLYFSAFWDWLHLSSENLTSSSPNREYHQHNTCVYESKGCFFLVCLWWWSLDKEKDCPLNFLRCGPCYACTCSYFYFEGTPYSCNISMITGKIDEEMKLLRFIFGKFQSIRFAKHRWVNSECIYRFLIKWWIFKQRFMIYNEIVNSINPTNLQEIRNTVFIYFKHDGV